MSDQAGASTRVPDWRVVESGRTSVGAQCWTLRHGTTQASVAAYPRGTGVLIVFIDADLPLRAVAHAARCYATACAEVLASVEAGRPLDARPVSASGGSVEINGSDAVAAVSTYFGEGLLGAGQEEVR